MHDEEPALKPQASTLWTVRTGAGQVFGPVAFDVLKSWAAEGRIAPDYQLSYNEVTWLPPSAVPELAMDWVVELELGRFFGPIHRHTVDEMLRDPRYRKARVFQQAAAESPVPVDTEQVQELERQLAQERQAIESLKLEQGRLADALSASQKEAEELRGQIDGSVESVQTEVRQLTEANAALIAENESLRRQGQAVVDVEQVMKQKQEQLADTLAKAEQEAGELRRRLDAAAESAQAEAQRLLEQNGTLTAELDRLLQQCDELKQTCAERDAQISDLDSRLIAHLSNLEVIHDIEVVAPERPSSSQEGLGTLEEQLQREIFASQGKKSFF